MCDIFLSYANEDRERVRPLAEALIQEGWSVFWDRVIPVGKTWHEMLEEELSAARSLLIVWSEKSIKSKWVREEADEGLRMELPLFPVLLDGVLPPLGFRHIQAADFSIWDGSPTSLVFQNLVHDIKQNLGPPATAKHVKLGIPETEPTELVVLKSRPAEPSDFKPKRRRRVVFIAVAAGMAVFLTIVLLWYFLPLAKNGRLFVNTNPKEAKVMILNTQVNFYQGMELKPGIYHVEVSADGYETKRDWIELNAGEDRHVNITLAKIEAPGVKKSQLFVNTEPQEAAIRILNIRAQFNQGMELEPGSYHVEVSADGFETKKKWVELSAGEFSQINIKLVKIKEPMVPQKPPLQNGELERTFKIQKINDTGEIIYFYYDLGSNKSMDLNSGSATEDTMQKAREFLNNSYKSGTPITVYYEERQSRRTGKGYELLTRLYSEKYGLIEIKRKYKIP